jgi:hypothetical protein
LTNDTFLNKQEGLGGEELKKKRDKGRYSYTLKSPEALALCRRPGLQRPETMWLLQHFKKVTRILRYVPTY